MHLGHRHQSMRRRGVKQTGANSARLTYSIDTLAYVVSLLSLFFTLDQVRIIWIDHNANGVSFLSWTFYAVSSFVWFCYGLIHKDRVLIVTSVLWVIFSLVVVFGVVLYR